MTRRLTVPTPAHGWDHPWPNLFELAASFPAENWTLVGGLMVQAHALAHGVPINRPTEDLDVMLHVEAHIRDQRDRERHLFDAATLAACITDHAAELARLKGSDGRRLRHLAEELADPRHAAWLYLPEPYRTAGQDTVRILTTW